LNKTPYDDLRLFYWSGLRLEKVEQEKNKKKNKKRDARMKHCTHCFQGLAFFCTTLRDDGVSYGD